MNVNNNPLISPGNDPLSPRGHLTPGISSSSSSAFVLNETSKKIALIVLGLGIGGILSYKAGEMIYRKLNEHNINKLGTPSKFSQGMQRFEERIRENRPLVRQQEYQQITVLDQTYSQVGHAQCGAHSIKNTLVGIGMLFSPPLADQDWFVRKDLYENLMNYIYDRNPHLDRNHFDRADIGITDIQNALNVLVNSDPEQLNPDLRKFQEICREASSMFSIFNADIESNYINSVGPLAFNSMLNLSKLNQEQHSFVHGFAIGDITAGHWLTLFLQQDGAGNRHWFGCNSYHNDEGTLALTLSLLNNAIQNSSRCIRVMYFDNYDVNFKKYNNSYFNEDGSLQPDTDIIGQKLKIAAEHIDDALKAFNFMREVGWLHQDQLQNQEINDFVETLTNFAHYMVITNECNLKVEQKTRFQEMERELNGLRVKTDN